MEVHKGYIENNYGYEIYFNFAQRLPNKTNTEPFPDYLPISTLSDQTIIQITMQ